MLIVAGLATMAVASGGSYHFSALNWSLFWIDVGLFGCLAGLALVADRFWPMWLAALQLVAVASHGIRAYDPTLPPLGYWLIAGKIAYPMLMVLLLGTLRHRQRKFRGFPEYSWTIQRMKHDKRNYPSPPDIQ